MRKFISNFSEVPECFKKISSDPNCRVVIITAAGRLFTAGFPLQYDQKYIVIYMYIIFSIQVWTFPVWLI
jgi:hypothetical protein